MDTQIKTIKGITTLRYDVQLVEMPNGKYRILVETPGNLEPELSEAVDDYITASMLFDMKVQDLQGN